MSAQKTNIKDIAQKAGVSITTVSRVLNGKAGQFRISPEAQQKIKKAAEELNYIPNQFAASLKSGKSNTVALIIPSLSNPFFAGIASEINTEVRKQGYVTLIGDSDENQEIEKEELQQIVSRNIEGLIIAPCSGNSEPILRLYRHGFPVVCIDRYFENSGIPYISSDNFEGAKVATKHLIENGHSEIICIQGNRQSTPNKLRIEGFINAMEEAGLKSYRIAGNEFSTQNGYLETQLVLRQKKRPTAVFALSNTIALGCIQALKEARMMVPDEISLITFDDHPYLDYLATPLTCVTQPIGNICKLAVRLLFSLMNGTSAEPTSILLKPEIKYRDSVKRIN